MPLEPYYVDPVDTLRPFRGTPTPPDPPPPQGTPRQIIGMTVPSSGASFSSSVSQTGEERRLANLYGWPHGGPPVQRIFRQTQNPPFDMLSRIFSEGRVPWVSLKPTSSVTNDRAGNHDARWTSWGTYLASLRNGNATDQIWVTYDHENDRHTHSGSADRNSTGWVNYQTDWREAFRRIIGLMRAADTTHGLDHVSFVMIWTGWGYRGASNRDPGMSWHPDFDVVASDPYDEYMTNDGTTGAHRQFWSLTSTSTGAREHYEWGTDPLQWYDDYHSGWTVPSMVTNNLDKFPVRMAVGETGTQFRMQPNGSNTLWVPTDDPDSLTSQQAIWLTNMADDLRTLMPRMEVVCYWPESTQAIGSSGGRPNYFHGPSANRWGAEFAGPIAALRAETIKTNHQGAITPWTPEGLVLP